MGLFLRSSSLANPGNTISILSSALSYAQADGNFMYLLTNMSGSAINITGSTSIVGALTVTGNITGNLVGTASWANNAVNSLNATSASFASTASRALNAISSSFASTASQAATASYVLNAVSSSFASTASYVLNAVSTSLAATASNVEGGTQYRVPVWTGATTLGTSSLYESGSVLKTISGSTDIGLKLDFASNIYEFGQINDNNATKLRIEDSNKVIKTGRSSTDEGIYLNLQSKFYWFGNYNGSNYLILNEGLLGSPSLSSVIDNTFNSTIFSQTTTAISIASNGSPKGLKLDFFTTQYALGDFDNTSGSTKLVIDDNARRVTISGSLDVSGSGRFTNGLTVTGSLIVSGSSTFTNIGTTSLTGSLNVTGSTTQTGNNTLIGNTTLSGSINISGSQTFYGTSAFYGNHTLSGSNTITGNTVMSGSITVSGSSDFKNSLFIVTGSSFFKGTHAVSGSTDITGSLNVTGDFNVISGSSFRRWGNKLFNYGSFYHTASINPTQNVSGSFIYSTTTESEGVSIISGSRITFDNTGKYNIQFSAQLSTPTAADVYIWLKNNGTNVADTAGRLTTSNNDNLLPSWNYLVPISSGSYLEVAYQTTATNTTFPYVAAAGNIPGIPPIIVTVTQVA